MLHQLGAITVLIFQKTEVCVEAGYLSRSDSQLVAGLRLHSQFLEFSAPHVSSVSWRVAVCRMTELSTFRNPWSLSRKLEDFRNNPKVLRKEKPSRVSKLLFFQNSIFHSHVLPMSVFPPPTQSASDFRPSENQ